MTRLSLMVAAAAMLAATGAHAEMRKFHATLNGASEVPPHADVNGTGTVDATLDTTSKKLDYNSTWKDLSGPATAAHFHGPAAAGANAGPVVPWGSTLNSPFTGSATLTDPQIADLEGGRWYANVHTAKNPNGEIRGQMMKQ